MPPPPEPPVEGEPFHLDFAGQPIRAVISEGSLWFDAREIFALLCFNYERNLPLFDKVALDSDLALFAFGDEEPVHVVSPIAVWRLSVSSYSREAQKVSAWAKREATRLIPAPAKGDPRLFLTLKPDGTLPARPDKYSGRKAEWEVLRASPEYSAALCARTATRTPITPRQPRRIEPAPNPTPPPPTQDPNVPA